MRLFGYIAVFVDDVRYDERTIWHHTRWGRGGPQCEAHVRWGRGDLIVTARHCCGPTEGRGGPNPIGPYCHGPTGVRGGPSPPVTVPPQGPAVMVPLEEEEVPAPPPCRGPTGRKEMPCLGTALGKFFAILFSQKCRRFFSPFFLINTIDL
jgi:hypothetical protein